MSQSNENGSSPGRDQYEDADGREICKDFLRNVCNRGNKCKFYHPSTLTEQRPKNEYEFCHDFQNRGCKRDNCRFVHCTREDEEAYKRGGRMTDQLAHAILVSGQGTTANINGVPICKDFLVGKCDRGKRCRYWHIMPPDNREMSMDVRRPHPPPAQLRDSGRYDDYGRRGMSPPDPYYGRGFYDGFSAPMMGMGGRKRLREDDLRPPIDYASDYIPSGPMRPPSPLSYASLHEENVSLKRRIDVLKKQVSDLTAANEVLLEQNARLRAKQVLSSSHHQGSDSSIVASMTAAAQSLSALQYVTAPSAQSIQNNPDALAAAAVAVSLAQQAARQNLALTMSAPSSAASLVSYPSSYARTDYKGQGPNDLN